MFLPLTLHPPLRPALSPHLRPQAPAGSPPNLWRRIPNLILQSAVDNWEALQHKPAALHSLLRAAQEAISQSLEREMQLQQRVQGLEQQVAQLQGSMAAVLQQLQLPGPAGSGA